MVGQDGTDSRTDFGVRAASPPSVTPLRSGEKGYKLGWVRTAIVSPNPPHIIALPTSAFALRGKVARPALRGRDGWGAMAHTFARELRRNMTEAEYRLWFAVLDKCL